MSSTNQTVYQDVLALIHRSLPAFKVVAKTSSYLHRFIGWALRFPWAFGWNINRLYMTEYWTTIGQTTAYPTKSNPEDSWDIILHEQQHARQAKRWSLLFGPLYLLGTPVPLIALGLIAAACTPLWLWVVPWYCSLILVGLGLGLSIPVPFGRFRAACEYDAYGFSLALEHWIKGGVQQTTIELMAREFTSSAYFWMHPNKKAVMKRLNTLDHKIIDGKIFEDKRSGQLYWDVYKLLVQHNVTNIKYSVDK